MLELKDISKVYRMGENEVHALRGVDLRIDEGDFVAIMGPSGSGKSTLMHILGLLDVPSSGSYKVDDREVSRLSEDDLAVLRREVIGFIFQQFNLLPRMSAFENVNLPLLYSKKQHEGLGKELLERVGLGSRMDHQPNELSGGQQQRVAIARSLINRPLMILADEPTGNLDSKSEKEIMDILKELNAQGITVVVVTHEEEIGQQAKRLIRMRDGVVQSDERVSPLPVIASKAKLQDAGATRSPVFEFGEHFRQGFKTLMANKVRTALSMLGILIGVAAVVAMLALGNGAQKAIEAQLSSLGSNLLVLRSGSVRLAGVSQGSGSVTRLSMDDNQVIHDQISSVKATSPMAGGKVQVTFQNKNWSTQVQGAGPKYADMHALQPEIGRFFTEEDNQKRARVAVIGTTVLRELFEPNVNPIGEMIKINKVNFQIIGILPEKGATGWRDQDDIIVIPVMTAMKRLLGKEYLDYIEIEIGSAEEMETAEDNILALMNKRHRVPVSQTEAYEIRNMADIQAALSESSKTMSLLLASIAAISLLVGGIGIMNIMLVSVTERTREIGLRKAVGARRADILSQFLAEALVVSAVGGLIGILLGWVITTALSFAAGWTTSISSGAVFLSFAFSASIGIIFGIYPARKASQLHPIEALRYD